MKQTQTSIAMDKSAWCIRRHGVYQYVANVVLGRWCMRRMWCVVCEAHKLYGTWDVSSCVQCIVHVTCYDMYIYRQQLHIVHAICMHSRYMYCICCGHTLYTVYTCPQTCHASTSTDSMSRQSPKVRTRLELQYTHMLIHSIQYYIYHMPTVCQRMIHEMVLLSCQTTYIPRFHLTQEWIVLFRYDKAFGGLSPIDSELLFEM